MNIMFMTTGLARGGAETQLVRVALELRKTRGLNVSILSMLPPTAFMDELIAAGIPVHTLDMRRGRPELRAYIAAIGLVARTKPDVLVSFMYHANLLGRLVGIVSRIPVVISSIRNENFGGKLRDRVMWITHRMCNVTTTNSSLAAKSLIARGVVPADKLMVIPNGIDCSVYYSNTHVRETVRRELGIMDKEFFWLAVGRLETQKDYPNLLQAVRKIADGCAPMVLAIAGIGPLRDSLEATCHQMDISHLVRFLDLRTDIPRLLQGADALVLSSRWEGLPNIVMEALASSKPVVATQVGGVSELVEDGKSGLLVPPNSPDRLADAMLEIMKTSRATLDHMGQIGRAHIERTFQLEVVVGVWESLFRSLLGERRAK